VVISEHQSEGLAAGTEHSQHDFDSPGPAEWVPVAEGTSQVQSEASPSIPVEEHFEAGEQDASEIEKKKSLSR
jgi:hypothetical protein